MNEEKINDLSSAWKVDTVHLLERLLEENPKGSILMRPVQVFQSLLIQLTERALEINDTELNNILQKLCLIEEKK